MSHVCVNFSTASDRAKVYANMGHCSALIPQTNDAVSYYRLALKHDNSVADNYFYLASALLSNGELEDSENAIEEYFKWGGKSPVAYRLALEIATRLKRDNKAHFIKISLKAIKLESFRRKLRNLFGIKVTLYLEERKGLPVL